MLSTTDGKYVVRANTKRWDTANVYFKNYMTSIIRPQRLYHNRQAYGSNVKFLLVLKYKNDNEEVVPLHNGDERNRIFKNFTFTKESLSTKEKLENYIRLQKSENKIDYHEFEVISFRERVNQIRSSFGESSLSAEVYSYLKYHFFGRLFTILQDKKLKRENKKRRLEANKPKSE